jgi:hypothetical protein
MQLYSSYLEDISHSLTLYCSITQLKPIHLWWSIIVFRQVQWPMWLWSRTQLPLLEMKPSVCPFPNSQWLTWSLIYKRNQWQSTNSRSWQWTILPSFNWVVIGTHYSLLPGLRLYWPLYIWMDTLTSWVPWVLSFLHFRDLLWPWLMWNYSTLNLT